MQHHWLHTRQRCIPYSSRKGISYLRSSLPNLSPYLSTLTQSESLTSLEQAVKRFYFSRHPWVKYRILDKTIAAEYSRHLDEQKKDKQSEHQRKKRKAKKLATRKEKGTELERQGALEAGGKDKRTGGKSYKKCGNEDEDEDTAAGAAEEQAEVAMEKLAIGQVKPQTTQKSATGNDKRPVKEETKRKEEVEEEGEAKKGETQKKADVKKKGVWDIPWKKDSAVGEIRKPGWFFSGEDVLKEG
jgi:hypothetical protein